MIKNDIIIISLVGQAIMTTQLRLSYLRRMIRWGITIRVEHIRSADKSNAQEISGVNDGVEYLSTAYSLYDKDDYSEWVNCSRSLGGGCSSCGNENLIEATKNLLRLIRDNHLIKIENIWESVTSVPESEREGRVISIQWKKEKVEAPLVGTIFGNFTLSQQDAIENYRDQERRRYSERMAKIKQLISDGIEIRKDHYWDSDEDINTPADLTLECNQDLIKPKLASDYLKHGEYSPDDVKFDKRVVYKAIESKQVKMVQWAIDRCDSKTVKAEGLYYIRKACECGSIDIVKHLMSELKIMPDGKALREAVRSGDRELVDYLLSLNVDTDPVADIITYGDISDCVWNLIKYIHSLHPLRFSDTTLRNVVSHQERCNWLLQQGAERKWAIFDAAKDGDLTCVNQLLDTNSLNYEISEKRETLLFDAFRGMLKCGSNNGKPIYRILIERGLFDKFPMEKFVNEIYDNSWISPFEYAEEVLGSDRWNQLLTPKLAFKLYSRNPIPHFDKLVNIDLMGTFRLVANRREGIDKIVEYYIGQYGNEWADKIGNDIHNKIICDSGNPRYANSKGFRLYQSIYRSIGYRSAAELFEMCPNIEKDDVVGWDQQEKIFKENTFVDLHTDELKEDQQYRIIVFDYGGEEKGEDGYWRQQALYDVQNAKIVEKSHRGIKMKGTNNGPLKQINGREGEPDWIDEVKTFYLVDEDRFWSFHTGRDGGSLNCGGGYYVRIISNKKIL